MPAPMELTQLRLYSSLRSVPVTVYNPTLPASISQVFTVLSLNFESPRKLQEAELELNILGFILTPMSTPGTRSIKIDVISDFICAWCYIGHLELLRGIALARSRGLPVQFAIQYHPFILNPSLPDDGAIQKEQYFFRKFGSTDKAQEAFDMIRTRAKEEGLNLSLGGNIRQTTRAHRLLQKAYLYGGQKAQCALVRRLFRALFEDEQDIGDPHTLAMLASSQTYPFHSPIKFDMQGTPEITVTRTDAELELDAHADDDAAAIFDTEEEALAWVEGTEFEKEVRAMSADAARKGVTGVPFTVIDGRWAVSGCQKPECYYKIFAKLASSDTVLPNQHPTNGIQKTCTSESCLAEA